MPRPSRRAGLLVIALLAALATPSILAGHGGPPFVPEVLEGFLVEPFAAPPGYPTALAWGPGGADGPDLYATVAAGLVVRHPIAWTAGGPVAREPVVVTDGFGLPLGIVFDGDTGYVADSHPGERLGRTDGRVTRIEVAGYVCVDGDCAPQFSSSKVAVVDGLPNGRHNTNHLRFGPGGLLYVANGNPNDSGCPSGCNGGQHDIFPYSGAILSVDADAVSASPAVMRWRDASAALIPERDVAQHAVNADFRSKVGVHASGFRNVYGIAFSPAGIGYTGANGADEPSSQDLLYKLAPGGNYSYPFCYNVGPPGGVGAQVSVAPNPAYNDASKCVGTPAATALLGWHTCATGLDFPTAGPSAFPAAMQGDVFVGECGPFFLPDLLVQAAQDSATATHNTGHKVVRVALDANGDATAVQDFLTGLALPTDVLFGPDGAMYVADVGGVLRVAPLPTP